jgi:hypothetical protein
MEFEKGDKVTQLPCGESHLMHTDCLIDWIKHGENSCPLCRAPIENFEQIRDQMMAMGMMDDMEPMMMQEGNEGGELDHE